jgi:ribosomal protein S18 acetylase RimI-like enzyme
MNIRTVTINDVDALVQHNALMAMETENKQLDTEIVTAAVAAGINDPTKGFYLIAEIEGKTAGSLMVTYEWSDWRNANMWWVQSVYVRAEYRRQGVYKALYAEVKKLAQAEKVRIIRLYVEKENTRAQATYEALGMKESYYIMYEEEL